MKLFIVVNIVLIFSCSVFVFGGSSVAQINDLTSNNVLQNMSRAWKDYLKHIDNVEIECSTIAKDYSDAVRFVYCQPCCIKEITLADGIELIEGYNKKYTFSLKKSKDTDNWIIENIARVETQLLQQSLDFPDFTDPSQAHSRDGLIVRAIARGFMLTFMDFLPVISQKPEFVIDSVKKIVEDDQELIQLIYSYNLKEPLPNQFVRGGEILLMPNRYWLIKRAKSSCYDPGKKEQIIMDVINEYEDNSDGVPLIKKHSFTLNGAGYNNLTTEMVFSFFPPTSKITLSRFTLSHYGLPEPDFDNSRRVNRIRYVLIGSGILLIALALFQMYKKQQKKLP